MEKLKSLECKCLYIQDSWVICLTVFFTLVYFMIVQNIDTGKYILYNLTQYTKNSQQGNTFPAKLQLYMY